VAEAAALVREVASPGFGLHVDAGSITLNSEPIEQTIALAAPLTRHFHSSEPFLTPVGSGGSDHERLAAALRSAKYGGWVSVEMVASEGDTRLSSLRYALGTVSKAYGS
jgi:sugar phosphate isomerase/epimerase